MVTIYVLKCEHNKYYIGKTQSLQHRLLEHFTHQGSTWTQLHKPIEIIQTIQNCDDFDEDKYVKMYMSLYGIDNVRGGSYCQVSLTPEQIKLLSVEISSCQNRCHHCGKSGHFINNCPEISHEKINKPKRKYTCSRCGRNTHNVRKCHAKTHLNGDTIL